MAIRETKRSASSVADEVAAAEANLKAAQERLNAARQRFESAQNINSAAARQAPSSNQAPYESAFYNQAPSSPGPAYNASSAGRSTHKSQKDHIAAGALAIIFGALGIHKFYMGLTNVGFIVLGITIIGSFLSFGAAGLVMQLIGCVEGVIYLAKSQDAFESDYIRGTRRWF